MPLEASREFPFEAQNDDGSNRVSGLHADLLKCFKQQLRESLSTQPSNLPQNPLLLPDLSHQPITIHRGLLVCTGLGGAFFFASNEEVPTSIFPEVEDLNQDRLKQTCIGAANPSVLIHNKPVIFSFNQSLVKRLQNLSSPENVSNQNKNVNHPKDREVAKVVRGSKKRKNFKPYKSPSADDPEFSGVQIKGKYKLENGRLDFKMTHTFRNVAKSSKRPTTYKAPLYDSQSESDTKESPTYPSPPKHWKSHYAGKECASCGVRKTPLWRDAEDGTPLCNACGIRYKKYRIRCGRCWNIPRRGIKPLWRCFRCGKVF